MARCRVPTDRTFRNPARGAFGGRRRAVVPLLVATALALSLAQRLGAQEASIDRDYVLPLVNQALETERTGVEVPWFNPESGNSGSIVVQRTFYLEPGKPCREYRRTVERTGGPAVVVDGTGCRIGPEQWNLDEEEPSPVRVETPGAGSAGGAAAAPDPGAPTGCPPIEPAAGPPAPEPPAFASFTMPAKAKL